MASGKWVSYFRVSTDRQGKSGLGIEAQQAAVATFLNGGKWTVVASFTEVESGKRDDRPELAQAIALCRVHGAKLLIAKLDRLSRDAHFLLGLDKAGIEFVAADMPNAIRLTVGIMAMVAEEERHMISARTKAALQAAKARGVKLGGHRGGTFDPDAIKAGHKAVQARAAARGADLAPILAKLRSEGVTSATGLARALTERAIPTPRGGTTWQTIQVQRLLAVVGQ